MGIRWRKDGRLICAAMSEPEEGDAYFDDRVLGELANRYYIVADPDHKINGLWHWQGPGSALLMSMRNRLRRLWHWRGKRTWRGVLTGMPSKWSL